MFHTNERVCQYYSYDTLTTAMDRHRHSGCLFYFKTLICLSKFLGLSPYHAVGDIGNSNIIVRVPAIIHSLGMFIANVGLFIYRFIEMTTWKISRILVKIFYILGHYAMQYLVTSHLS